MPFLVGAERLMRWRETMTGATEALGLLAVGVVFFIAAAIALELSREWITVAYAIEFAAVAAIAARLDLLAMRQLCWPLLAVVVVRFVLNPEVLDYPLGVTPIFNWILWGYGISIAALMVGLGFLRPTSDGRLVRASEAAIALLAFALVTLEVRSVFQHDAMAAADAGFMERTFYVLAWGAFALAALWLARTRHEAGPGVDVARRIADHRRPSGRAARSVQAHALVARDGQHAVGIGIAQVGLRGERKALEVFEAV